MARASAWGYGSALAYENLGIDAQARLLALYAASRQQESDEAKKVVLGALGEFAHAAVEGFVASKNQEDPNESTGRQRAKPRPPAVPPRKTQANGREAPLLAIRSNRMSLKDMLTL